MTICYADKTCKLVVNIIFSWDRGDIPNQIMSSSSGPKEYLKNDIWGLFDANPEVDRIMMVRGSGPPFLILRNKECWFDSKGKQVIGA